MSILRICGAGIFLVLMALTVIFYVLSVWEFVTPETSLKVTYTWLAWTAFCLASVVVGFCYALYLVIQRRLAEERGQDQEGAEK